MADSLFFHARKTVRAGGQGFGVFHDRFQATYRTRGRGPGKRWGSQLRRPICRAGYEAAAFRLHLEPHDAMGYKCGRGLHVSTMWVRTNDGARTNETFEVAFRPRIPIPHGVHENW